MGLACADCGSEMVLRRAPRAGYVFYGCTQYPKCQGIHSAHQQTHAPMGVPADRVTRGARKFAHMLFDQLWKHGGMTRREAYAWLREVLGVTNERAHISMLNKDECDRLIAACKLRGLVVADADPRSETAQPKGNK